MTHLHHDTQRHARLHTRAHAWWRQPVVLGSVGLGLLLASLALTTRLGLRPSPDKPGDAVSGHAPEVAPPSDGSQHQPVLGHTGAPPPGPTPAAASRTSSPGTSPTRPSVPAPRAESLQATFVRLGQSTGGITQEDADDLNQRLQELRTQGPAAVPTIRDLLRRVEYRPLRLALFDLLDQIDGSAALDVSLEQLPQTTDPVEIATLGWALEQRAPGLYREVILQVARDTLQWAAHNPPTDRGDMSPLFALLQAYGGPDVVAALDQYRTKWWEYALMALAALPAGEGIPKLAALAGDPNVPLEYKPTFPFRMLAQASMQAPEAGVALLELARAGQIPEEAWSLVGAALEGKHLHFSQQFSDATRLPGHAADGARLEALLARENETRPVIVRAVQPVAAAQGSAEQINQQLALIDELLDVTDSSVAVHALRQARASLLHGSH